MEITLELFAHCQLCLETNIINNIKGFKKIIEINNPPYQNRSTYKIY